MTDHDTVEDDSPETLPELLPSDRQQLYIEEHDVVVVDAEALLEAVDTADDVHDHLLDVGVKGRPREQATALTSQLRRFAEGPLIERSLDDAEGAGEGGEADD